MKNYKIIELSNGTKHIILDTIIYNNEIYTLTKEIIKEIIIQRIIMDKMQ